MPAIIPASPPGIRRRAFVTFLMCNDSYLPGCLMTAYGLVRQGSRSPRVCVVTPDVSPAARTALAVLYDRVVEVGRTPLPGDAAVGPGDRPRTGSARMLDAALTRFSVLRLGADGDLGCAYDKVVMLDADLLPLRDFESLWALPAPAGIVNERREHMAEIDRSGRLVVRPESLATGRWVWHEVYGATCPHGTPVPVEITDRVAVDHDNYGINASLLVLEPSMSAYNDFLRWVGSDDVRDLVRAWRWTDQQAATLYWSGRWCSVDPSYSTLYGYPTLRLARGLHFAGVKPWAWRRKGFARRLQRFPDHRLWAEVFVEMLDRYPALARHRGLGRLAREIGAAIGPAARTRQSPAQAAITPTPPRELRPARAARRSQGSSSTPGPRRRRTSA